MKAKRTKKCVEFHVSPRGNDLWSGLIPERRDGDGPFATIQRARDAIIALKSKEDGLRCPVRVVLRGGVYALDSTLTFAHEDSGTTQCPIIYTAHPGETVVLSGGRRISDWCETTHNGRNCWMATLPDVAAGRWNFTQLFVNGKRRPRTRLPKQGWYQFAGVTPEFAAAPWNKGPDRALFKPGEIKPWKNLSDVRLYALQLWFESHHRIKALDMEKNMVMFRANSMGNLKDEKGEFARYFMENIFEALETPGEWYLDRPTGKLYYLPMDGETMAGTEVVAPRLETLVRFAGMENAPVSNIRLENLAFQHAEWDYPPENHGSIQAAFKVPGAVILDRAEDCVLYRCEISHIAQYGVEVGTGSSRNSIVACSIFDMGAGGVRVDHEWMDRVNETAVEPVLQKSGSKPSATTISDCEIHDGTLIHLSAIGIWIGNAGFNRILHNHIYNLNYTGISCGWTWGYAPAATMDNRIENNHVHHINWDRILSDNGCIYTLGQHPGSTISGNLLHHVGCYGYGGWGIYPDEGSSEFIIENNIVHHTQHAGFHTNYGRDNIVRNNIFALMKQGVVAHTKLEQHRTTIFERNIVCWREGKLAMRDWPAEHLTFLENLFWNGDGKVDFGRGLGLVDMQKLGQHLGTLVADPLFVDAEAGDFRLKPKSPARKLGFKPIDISGVGPRRKNKWPASFADWRFSSAVPKEIVRTRISEVRPGRIQVTVENVGTLPSSGSMKLKAGPAGRASISGKAGLSFKSLRPGQSKTAEFPVRISPDARRVTVETLPTGRGLVPALQHICRNIDWRIPAVAAVGAPDRVAGALEVALPRSARWMDQPTAQIRAGIAGGDLAFHALVIDREIKRNDAMPFAASCIEVFGAVPGGKTVRQLYLVPAAGGLPASGALQDGTQVKPAPDIRLVTQPTDNGYEMQALIPLRLLGIEHDSTGFMFEAVVTSVLQAGKDPVRGVLFNSMGDVSRESTGYGVVTVCDARAK